MRVFVTQHEGHTLYWDSLESMLLHLEHLLPEMHDDSEVVVSIGDVAKEDFDDLPEHDGY